MNTCLETSKEGNGRTILDNIRTVLKSALLKSLGSVIMQLECGVSLSRGRMTEMFIVAR